MVPGFDAYHKWLAIPPAEQPPNLYRLLALNLFESDSDVIDSAANARMIHLRSLQTGPHSELTQKLLNEIAAARLCLLKPEKKASYDAVLRSQMASTLAARTPPPLPVPPTDFAQAMSPGPTAAESTLFDFISATYQSGEPDIGKTDRLGSRHAASRSFAGKKHSASGKKAVWPRLLMILGPLVGIGVVAAAIAFRDSHDPDVLSTASHAGSAAGASGQPAIGTATESSSNAKPSAAKTASSSPAQPTPSGSGNNAVVIAKPPTTVKPPSGLMRASDANSDVKPLPPPATGKLRLEYRCLETKPETNQIRFHLQIENDGDDPLRIADLKVRYWYASVADKPRNFWCDYAVIGKDNVAGRFVAIEHPAETAAGYLELTFSAEAGEINPGANSGEIQCRFAVDDWSNLDQSKDFSFDPAATQWSINPHLAIYEKGKLVSGQEPVR